jgi:branched-chain amino acid transport system substrate-binding protein
MGDNKKVPMMAPDGFTGFPDEDKLPQSQGEYLTFAGLSSEVLSKVKGPGGKLLAAFKAKYHRAPAGSYPLYGVAAMQVILAAIAKSDGTRASVNSAVFTAPGITIPTSQSVTGKAIQISATTGDTSAHDVTVEIMKNHQETFFKSESVK